MLDEAAHTAGKRMWVEKTPHHIDYIPVIAAHVPAVRFIHLLRDGRDVVASQFHAQRQDPEFWRKWSVEKMASAWNRDTTKSLHYKSDRMHLLVSYEALLTATTQTLARVTAFMGIEFVPSMLRFQDSAAAVVGWRKGHPWMQNVFNPLHDTRLKKFGEVFTAEQQQRVEQALLWNGRIAGQFEGARTVTTQPVVIGEPRRTV
jgi:hypothetical protein